jgi:hypothetical protein
MNFGPTLMCVSVVFSFFEPAQQGVASMGPAYVRLGCAESSAR